MVTLNDYLYSGDTMFKILKNYSRDLKAEAKQTNNEIDLIHANFLIQIRELLEHNDFLTTQSQKIREFYIHMAKEYPLLAFNFKGRIKVADPLGGENLMDISLNIFMTVIRNIRHFRRSPI